MRFYIHFWHIILTTFIYLFDLSASLSQPALLKVSDDLGTAFDSAAPV